MQQMQQMQHTQHIQQNTRRIGNLSAATQSSLLPRAKAKSSRIPLRRTPSTCLDAPFDALQRNPKIPHHQTIAQLAADGHTLLRRYRFNGQMAYTMLSQKMQSENESSSIYHAPCLFPFPISISIRIPIPNFNRSG